ncbi:hypothetical protein TrRE_jg12068 [Triparma retinervis]|uniref:Uncharacterized protein n=1 Tax=Triparma retinervis TaxID=2557542 RepID=A0A9W6Z185_9STRA|nr:hypothetical protein TrRE_jg12068 [Triparma retinervis]
MSSRTALTLGMIGGLAAVTGQEITTDYPTLPTKWEAETIEPGAPASGKGIEAYSFVDVPSYDTPSALWSNYTGCQRLIYIPNNYDQKRYLLGCDVVDCCYEEQDGNQIEFQIPNVHYADPSKTVDVYYQKANVTNWSEVVEADEWSWSFGINDNPLLTQDMRAYTLPCDKGSKGCPTGVKLVQWQSRAAVSDWFAVEFKNFKGFDDDSDESDKFLTQFQIPDICQKNNLLKCDDR